MNDGQRHLVLGVRGCGLVRSSLAANLPDPHILAAEIADDPRASLQ
jgi:hypothetical protein